MIEQKTQERAKEWDGFKRWTLGQGFIAAGVISIVAAAASIIYCNDKIPEKMNSRYPTDENQQERFEYKTQLENQALPNIVVLETLSVGFLVAGGVIEKRRKE